MLMFQTNPVGVELFSKLFVCSNKFHRFAYICQPCEWKRFIGDKDKLEVYCHTNLTLSLAHWFTFVLTKKVVWISFTSSVQKWNTLSVVLVEIPPNLVICTISGWQGLITKVCPWNGICGNVGLRSNDPPGFQRAEFKLSNPVNFEIFLMRMSPVLVVVYFTLGSNSTFCSFTFKYHDLWWLFLCSSNLP